MNASQNRNTGLLKIAAIGLFAGACVGAGVLEGREPEPAAPALKPGAIAPAFKLQDLLGKEADLAALTREGKIVVIEWFNPECEWVAKYHKDSRLMAETYKTFASKGVAWLAINSSQDHTAADADRNRKAKADWGIEYPILRDRDGSVAKLYGVTKSPHVFIIGADGKVVYTGAVDDSAAVTNKGKRNYVAEALERLVADETVKIDTSPVNGCPLNKASAPEPSPPANPPK